MKRLLVVAAAIALSACSSMPSWVPGSGWTTLIDGDKGMENFQRVGDANWRAEEGAIVADKGKGGFLLSNDSYKDFQLRIEFWAAHNANSGIYMRCSVREKLTDKLCHEANIFDERPDPTFGTGGIVHMGKVLQPVKAGGKWNTYDITARGRNITVVLNGVKTAEIDNAEFLNGPIALQFGNLPNNVPGGAIKFRKVQVRPL
jgi:Domain of Unknown Function (DUF1080)